MQRSVVASLVLVSFGIICLVLTQLHLRTGKTASASSVEAKRLTLEALGIQSEDGNVVEALRKAKLALSVEIATLNATKQLLQEQLIASVVQCKEAQQKPAPSPSTIQLKPDVPPVTEEKDGDKAKAVFVGDPAECDQWDLPSLWRLPRQGTADPWANWNKPIGLAYTVAPTHCLQNYGWSHDHLADASEQYRLINFLHVMKTGGTSIRQQFMLYAGKNKNGTYCGMYNKYFRLGGAEGNATLIAHCIDRYNGGHLMQFGYQNKFPQSRFFGQTAFHIMAFRDPFLRALSVYDYFSLSLLPKEEFFTKVATSRANFMPHSTFWATDIFWYLGVDRIRSTDSLEEQLRKLEQCKFVIRSVLPLIAERPLESQALLAVALGGKPPMPILCNPLRLNEKYGTDSRLMNVNITRRTARIAMAKMRHARVLYEYAHMIFDMRLSQFGVGALLRATCNETELRVGGVGHPKELTYMDQVLDILP